ncbi:hypothetical protein AT575_09625 [Streptococcus penaeicida]|uniref:Epimerase n=1 Tax=Streptococcus penaeicida TaxID=1765960 RepID=A0A2N8LA49_9STRE|nr:DUF1304 domain-containing protein [Streptococcus penaeicida]PND47032.1 hypothetical protein AT575_09625 [Streptococcus penaeicida]
MSIITIVLATLTALEQIYIMYLETFATASAATQKVFQLSQSELEDKTIASLFKNQGIYNGLIAFLLLYGIYLSHNSEIVALFLINVIVAAIYGAMTVDKKILLKQGGLAILALISMLF